MRVQYFSDLFLSGYPSFKDISRVLQNIKKKAPVLLLNGNIGNPNHISYHVFLSKMSSLQFDKIFIIPGNYEYYGNTIERAEEKSRAICVNYSNVVFLNNSYYDYGGYRFVGSTFWSEIKNTDFLWDPDFQNIRQFSVEKQNHIHSFSKRYIHQMKKESPFPIIMMSYHIPSFHLHHEHQDKDYAQCFYSDSEDCISFPIYSWFHGYRANSNVSQPFFYKGIPFYCNPAAHAISLSSFDKIAELPSMNSHFLDPQTSKND